MHSKEQQLECSFLLFDDLHNQDYADLFMLLRIGSRARSKCALFCVSISLVLLRGLNGKQPHGGKVLHTVYCGKTFAFSCLVLNITVSLLASQ